MKLNIVNLILVNLNYKRSLVYISFDNSGYIIPSVELSFFFSRFIESSERKSFLYQLHGKTFLMLILLVINNQISTTTHFVL